MLEAPAARFLNQFQFSAAFNYFVEGAGGSKEAELGGRSGLAQGWGEICVPVHHGPLSNCLIVQFSALGYLSQS